MMDIDTSAILMEHNRRISKLENQFQAKKECEKKCPHGNRIMEIPECNVCTSELKNNASPAPERCCCLCHLQGYASSCPNCHDKHKSESYESWMAKQQYNRGSEKHNCLDKDKMCVHWSEPSDVDVADAHAQAVEAKIATLLCGFGTNFGLEDHLRELVKLAKEKK